MRKTSLIKALTIIILTALVACSETRGPLNATVPVSSDEVADAVFFWNNNGRNYDKISFYLYRDTVLESDEVNPIIYCDLPDQLHVCMIKPYPFFVPKKRVNEPLVFSVDEVSYTVTFSSLNGVKQRDTVCDLENMTVRVEDDAGEIGIYTYSVTDGLQSAYFEGPDAPLGWTLIKDRGALFSLTEKCD